MYLCVTLRIVDLWQFGVCCVRSRVIRWCSTRAVCASAGYTRCVNWPHFGIYLCASSLKNLAVPHDFHSPLSISGESVSDGVILAGFKSCLSWANASSLAKAALSLFDLYCFHFLFVFLWVGIVWLGSSD